MVALSEILRLMLIASQLSGLPMTAEPPLVFEQPDAEVQRAFCKGGQYCVAVYGFTDVSSGEVHISDQLNEYSRETILVHELTHWLEFKAGVNQHNYCMDERTAYEVEVKYLLQYEHRADPEPVTFHCGKT